MAFSKKVMGKEVGEAKVYAPPHTMAGKSLDYKDTADIGFTPKEPMRKKDWIPLMGVSIGMNDEVKKDGIKMRGAGAATKGFMSRGPMA